MAKSQFPKTPTARRLEADRKIKLGEKIHTAVVLGGLIAPLMLFANHVFAGGATDFGQFFNLLGQKSDVILLAFLALFAAAFWGRVLINRGLEAIDAIEG